MVQRPALQLLLAPFDGFHETAHAVTGTRQFTLRRRLLQPAIPSRIAKASPGHTSPAISRKLS